ncbi:nitroreductase [Caenispirillum bisanense]|uniref:Putative NAD(P)H nitroreductase n=1 Tax=Caenispirillum bisanense TaxID=414052 RepID=A0A286H1R3_9PROT|nr:nitroreductase [Caenispirillum bisanense]SOE01681.1 Nitroreductase [Caenispirillum bisanense]
MTPHPVLDLILSRRSVAPRRLAAPGPSAEQIHTLVACAVTAPDHGDLRPWRFLRVAPGSRDRLAEAFVAAKRELEPEPTDVALERARAKAHKEPETLVVIFRPDRAASIPVQEQAMSVGAACENILLAAEAMGYGGMLISGGEVTTRALRDAFGLAASEELVGFIGLGTVANPPGPRERPAPEDVLAEW